MTVFTKEVRLPLLLVMASGPVPRAQHEDQQGPHQTFTSPRYTSKGTVSTCDLCPDLELKKADLPSSPPELWGPGMVHLAESWVGCENLSRL